MRSVGFTMRRRPNDVSITAPSTASSTTTATSSVQPFGQVHVTEADVAEQQRAERERDQCTTSPVVPFNATAPMASSRLTPLRWR